MARRGPRLAERPYLSTLHAAKFVLDRQRATANAAVRGAVAPTPEPSIGVTAALPEKHESSAPIDPSGRRTWHRDRVLPDILEPGLRLVLVGTAVGERSAERGHYYAGPGNSFWTFLRDAGLTPTLLRPEDDRRLLGFGLGLTDLVKTMAQSHDRGLPYDIPEFDARIQRYHPRFVAFTSKAAGSAYARGRRLDAPGLGLQPWKIGSISVFVLPSPSGANRAPTDPPRIEWWKRLGQLVAATP